MQVVAVAALAASPEAAAAHPGILEAAAAVEAAAAAAAPLVGTTARRWTRAPLSIPPTRRKRSHSCAARVIRSQSHLQFPLVVSRRPQYAADERRCPPWFNVERSDGRAPTHACNLARPGASSFFFSLSHVLSPRSQTLSAPKHTTAPLAPSVVYSPSSRHSQSLSQLASMSSNAFP